MLRNSVEQCSVLEWPIVPEPATAGGTSGVGICSEGQWQRYGREVIMNIKERNKVRRTM